MSGSTTLRAKVFVDLLDLRACSRSASVWGRLGGGACPSLTRVLAALPVALLIVALCGGLLGACANGTITVATGDEAFAQAFAEQAEDLPVEGRGTVTRLLADDTEGGRHQRFVVGLDSGQTLLIVHNIDVAPRVASLGVGDTVEFKGEYVWNEEGGLVHWTHRDPDGSHEPGWIRHDGKLYR